jgi:hypothetical protein
MNETLTSWDGLALLAPFLTVCIIFIIGHEIKRNRDHGKQ